MTLTGICSILLDLIGMAIFLVNFFDFRYNFFDRTSDQFLHILSYFQKIGFVLSIAIRVLMLISSYILMEPPIRKIHFTLCKEQLTLNTRLKIGGNWSLYKILHCYKLINILFINNHCYILFTRFFYSVFLKVYKYFSVIITGWDFGSFINKVCFNYALELLNWALHYSNLAKGGYFCQLSFNSLIFFIFIYFFSYFLLGSDTVIVPYNFSPSNVIISKQDS